MRQPGYRRSAVVRANHAARHNVIDNDEQHDDDDAGYANNAAINDIVAKFDEHNADAGWRIANHNHHQQHDHDSR